jgi:hypothetical protein
MHGLEAKCLELIPPWIAVVRQRRRAQDALPFHGRKQSDQAGRSSEFARISLRGVLHEPPDLRTGGREPRHVTIRPGRGPQPGLICGARDLYSGDPAAIGKVYLKVMPSLLTAAPPVANARLPDGALKEVANPSLVIPQVLIVRQRDRDGVGHDRSIGSRSDNGRTHYAAGAHQTPMMLVK